MMGTGLDSRVLAFQRSVNLIVNKDPNMEASEDVVKVLSILVEEALKTSENDPVLSELKGSLDNMSMEESNLPTYADLSVYVEQLLSVAGR